MNGSRLGVHSCHTSWSTCTTSERLMTWQAARVPRRHLELERSRLPSSMQLAASQPQANGPLVATTVLPLTCSSTREAECLCCRLRATAWGSQGVACGRLWGLALDGQPRSKKKGKAPFTLQISCDERQCRNRAGVCQPPCTPSTTAAAPWPSQVLQKRRPPGPRPIAEAAPAAGE